MAASKTEAGKTRMVIGASSVGTVFEWYDFFIWGTLTASGILQRSFFPPGDELLATLLAWATFAVGFAFRPLGAILFGYLGDKLGRKYTFLVTITLMGVATAGIGLIPSYAAIGVAAPLLIILLRILQGLALGGEYGGAAIYVASIRRPEKRAIYQLHPGERGALHPEPRRGAWVQGDVSDSAWLAWGGGCPSCSRSCCSPCRSGCAQALRDPVFKELKESGGCARNPFRRASPIRGTSSGCSSLCSGSPRG